MEVNTKNPLAFKSFLHKMEEDKLEVKEKANGTATIQQTTRNKYREEGVAALLQDLISLYGDEFDIVETADGICFVAENGLSDITITWELKSTIKSTDYDPFLEASRYDETRAEKLAKNHIICFHKNRILKCFLTIVTICRIMCSQRNLGKA